MCTRYITPEMAEMERHWQIDSGSTHWPRTEVFPRSRGVFIRARSAKAASQGAAGGSRAGSTATAGMELVQGVWGLIPHFAKTAQLPYATVNARSEEMASKPSYRAPWARGQRCIIPAVSFDEPCWESGRNVWWRFHQANGEPWGLAGLWAQWTDPSSGEVLESYTMLTLNADAHPLMSRMHKPDPKLPPDQQDKRSVVALPPEAWAEWLSAPREAAAGLIRLTPVEQFCAGPAGSAAAPPPAGPVQPGLL